MKKKGIIIFVMIVVTVLLFGHVFPLEWVNERDVISQVDHSHTFGLIGDGTMSGYAQKFTLTEGTMISEAHVHITVPSVGTDMWMKFHPLFFDEGEEYLIGDAGDEFYFVILTDIVDNAKYYGGIVEAHSLPSTNPDDWNWYESRTVPIMSIHGTNTNSYSGGGLYEYDGGWSSVSGDLAFKIIGSTWYEPGQDEICWKCYNGAPISDTFPGGTICGEGLAQDYPYDTMPNCNVGNTWDLTIQSRNENNNVVSGATYTIIGPDGTSADTRTGTIGSSGEVILYDVLEGQYMLNGNAPNYKNEGVFIHVTSDITRTLLFVTEGVTLEFSVLVQDDSFSPIVGASVRIGVTTRVTMSDGTAIFTDMVPGTYDMLVGADGYNDYSTTLVVTYPMSIAHITLESTGDVPYIPGISSDLLYIVIGIVIGAIALIIVLIIVKRFGLLRL